MTGGVLSRGVDRAVNRTALPGRLYASSAATQLVRQAPAVDLLVGAALFRDTFVRGGNGGHVDLPRAEAVGLRLIGLTIATSWPDVRGSLSRWHFRSLGLQRRAVGSRLAIAEWVIGRIERWCAESAGRLRLVMTLGDLDACVAEGGPVGVFLGVQGAHALEGDLMNVARLRARGLAMLAPGHVMDNDAVGSGTGRRAGGLSGFGRELLAELEAQNVIVDLAHMSVAGIEDSLPILRRPFVLSHAGIRAPGAASTRRLRRYNASTRNVPADIAHEVGVRGGLFGVVLATQLLGGSTLAHAGAMIGRAIGAAGAANVALGSDMDGALRMVIDVEGLPALADRLLEEHMEPSVVSGVLGGNATRFLRASLS
jgi:microsomal dipeptidase-like Zn-dependent dipeptidase